MLLLHPQPTTHPSWFCGFVQAQTASFSFLTRAGELTSWIRPSISNEAVRRDVHHSGALQEGTD